MARPSKYTDERAALICKFIMGGANRDDAAQAAGITAETLRDWMNRRPAFSAQVMEADSTAVIVAEGSARKKDPIRWLQAKRPLIWGKNAAANTTEQDAKLDIILQRLDDAAAV